MFMIVYVLCIYVEILKESGVMSHHSEKYRPEDNYNHYWLVVSAPLKKKVSWDDYSRHMEK